MFGKILFAILSCCCSGIGAAKAQNSTQVGSLASIEQAISEDCAAGRFSGVALVVQNGRTVLNQMCGYAHTDSKLPIADETRYKIFSMSKPFTATAIMMLVERGKTNLDAPIRRYVPEAPALWKEVSVRHLLNHSSGIPDLTETLLDAYLKKGKTNHDSAMRFVLSNSGDKALKTNPGEVWAYNNFGYELLATLIERASGQSSADFIERNIFEPAGMMSASVELPLVDNGAVTRGRASPGLAQGYNGQPDKLKPATSHSFVQQGAGALHMGYRDLLAFNAALAKGEILSRRTQSLHQSEAYPIRAGTGYGLGWMVRNVAGKTYFQHSGGTNGFISDFARTSDGKNVVIILSNLGFAKAEGFRKSIMETLLTGPAS